MQDPYNTQNFNRFGYVLNNPLLYTDPSGEILVPILIGIGVAMLTTAIANISAGIPFWHGMGKAAVVGAISGAISFGIGEAVTGITSFWAKAGLQAGMHGMKSGMMSAIEGGSFLSGFAAGAISSLVSSGVEALGTNFSGSGSFRTVDGGFSPNSFGAGAGIKAVMIASGGLSGGISSSIAGGSFWKGVREGLITAGLNHSLHMMLDDGGGGGNGGKKKTEPWDKNGDGKLQKSEADWWIVNGNGKAITVNGNKIDISGLKVPANQDFEGGSFVLQTTEAFMQLPYETAATYGGSTFECVDGQWQMVRQEYHYDMRTVKSGSSFGTKVETVLRNIITEIGKPKTIVHTPHGNTFINNQNLSKFWINFKY